MESLALAYYSEGTMLYRFQVWVRSKSRGKIIGARVETVQPEGTGLERAKLIARNYVIKELKVKAYQVVGATLIYNRA